MYCTPRGSTAVKFITGFVVKYCSQRLIIQFVSWVRTTRNKYMSPMWFVIYYSKYCRAFVFDSRSFNFRNTEYCVSYSSKMLHTSNNPDARKYQRQRKNSLPHWTIARPCAWLKFSGTQTIHERTFSPIYFGNWYRQTLLLTLSPLKPILGFL